MITHSKETLIKIYQETQEIAKDFRSGKTTKHDLSEIEISPLKKKAGKITVQNTDTVSCIYEHKDENVAVLNMATNKRPGGGVQNGALAQEECLFRCSNLTGTLNAALYPFLDSQLLYSKEVTFFRDVNYRPAEIVTPDVITSAAFNLSNIEMPDNYASFTEKKIKLVLSVASKNDVDTLILGAWGCGVFKNNPLDVAKIFRKVLCDQNYRYEFEHIIFAIIDDKNSVAENYSIFENVFLNS